VGRWAGWSGTTPVAGIVRAPEPEEPVVFHAPVATRSAPAAWPPGAASVVTDLDGPVRHLDLGGPSGAPVAVCVHGLGGSALNWGLLAPHLTGRYRVLAIDLFGHGLSGVPTGSHRDAVASDLRLLDRFLREVVGEPVVLIGHSMGGVLAVLHTAAAPDTVHRLVLLGPPVPGSTGRVDLRIAAKRAFLRLPGVAGVVGRKLAGTAPEEVVRRQLAQATPHLDRVPADAVAAAVAETRERTAAPDAAARQAEQWAALLGTMALLARPRAWRQVLTRVDVPTLWLQGGDDPLVQPGPAHALAATRPDWTFELRPGVGHLLAVEDPAWTAERISAFAGDGEGTAAQD
jgi:pimeloyl-ACP methyl ester carboxylesterase